MAKPYDMKKGEVQFTEQGLSGICMFQFSVTLLIVLRINRRLQSFLDFMPEYSVSGIVKPIEPCSKSISSLSRNGDIKRFHK